MVTLNRILINTHIHSWLHLFFLYAHIIAHSWMHSTINVKLAIIGANKPMKDVKCKSKKEKTQPTTKSVLFFFHLFRNFYSCFHFLFQCECHFFPSQFRNTFNCNFNFWIVDFVGVHVSHVSLHTHEKQNITTHTWQYMKQIFDADLINFLFLYCNFHWIHCIALSEFKIAHKIKKNEHFSLPLCYSSKNNDNLSILNFFSSSKSIWNWNDFNSNNSFFCVQ